MNFTREPIVETVVSPREGCKLVIRNSKAAGQEEYFVDAIEVVRFGSALFFRSLERPKSFLLPVTDYEVLEVREQRVVLKHAVAGEKPARQPEKKKEKEKEEKAESKEEAKPKRRRQRRRRRGEEEGSEEKAPEEKPAAEEKAPEEKAPKEKPAKDQGETPDKDFSLLPPPPTLISDNISRYKELITEAEEAGPVEEKVVPEPVSEEAESPALVPPGAQGVEGPADTEEVAKGLGVFSASRFLRRLAGQERGEAATEEDEG